MRDLIKKLSDLRGISGFEYRLNDKIAEMFLPYADEVVKDSLGSVIAIKRCGKKNAPKIMIEAHCDEIGLMVTSVTDKGFITFASVGGVDTRVLPSMNVVVHGKKDIPGIIGIQPSYLIERGKSVKMTDMAVDTGLDAKTVHEIVSVGDSITIEQSVGKLGNRQWSGKTLDDRASVAALITAMKELSKVNLEADIYAVAAVQEEVGCRGGKTTAFGINPDMAIAIDVTHGITPDNSEEAFEVGSGAVIAVGPNLHPKLTKRLFDIAEKNKIKTATEVEGGNTGTDAWEMQIANKGIPTALLSLPLKYMHTSVETLAISDVKAVTELLVCFISDIKEDITWLKL